MKALAVPIRVVGPGSQPDEEQLQYLAIPREMETFRMPEIPGAADCAALSAAHAVLRRFADRFDAWEINARGPGPQLELDDVAPDALAVVNQMLGEGEVSIRVDGAQPLRVQETAFAGVWRVCRFDGDGSMTGDWIEAGALPTVVLQKAQEAAFPLHAAMPIPTGAMNSPALLHEIQSQVRACARGSPARVINLTLFPLSTEDHQVLEQALPVGPVAIMSRGFGNCRITSTGVRDVWRVQYFNSMNTLILNTLEVVDAPEVALAAADDLADSKLRFAELLMWMAEDIARGAND